MSSGKALVFRVLRFGFRLLPLGEESRDRCRQWFTDRYRHLVPETSRVVEVVERRTWPRATRADEPAIGHMAASAVPLPSPLPATLVAFHYPQSAALSNANSARGTWQDVTGALPQFEGHLQPRHPADLGLYDTEDPEALRAQATLARASGIGAFCFPMHWPHGAEQQSPARTWLGDPSLDLSCCLCWMNEAASALPQANGARSAMQDGLDFIRDVAPYLRDPRYLRVDGRPLLLVAHPHLLGDSAAILQGWRDWCDANGIGGIHVACVQASDGADPRESGFDAAVEQPPDIAMAPARSLHSELLNPEFGGHLLDWRELAAQCSARAMPAFPVYPGVTPGWDDEPANPGTGRVYLHASPRRYRDWLHATIRDRLAGRPAAQRIVFLNAWNNWRQGAVLEPDARLGHAWLNATRQALAWAAAPATPDPGSIKRPCAVIHAWYPDVLDELLTTLRSANAAIRTIITTSADRETAVREVLAARNMQAEILVFRNRGRDILPFLHVANRLLDEGVELVLKLHTKRSPHRIDGDAWRQELVTRIASPERIAAILRAFDEDPGLGLIGPEGHLQPLGSLWCENSDAVKQLSLRAGMPVPGDEDKFVAGSMFWARLEALRPLLDAHLQDSDFEPESGQLDGTLAHAVERVVAAWATHSGYRVASPASFAGEEPPPHAVTRIQHTGIASRAAVGRAAP